MPLDLKANPRARTDGLKAAGLLLEVAVTVVEEFGDTNCRLTLSAGTAALYTFHTRRFPGSHAIRCVPINTLSEQAHVSGSCRCTIRQIACKKIRQIICKLTNLLSRFRSLL
jgi:hypothetical protein